MVMISEPLWGMSPVAAGPLAGQTFHVEFASGFKPRDYLLFEKLVFIGRIYK